MLLYAANQILEWKLHYLTLFFQNLLDAKQTISQYVIVELKQLFYIIFWI